MVLYNRAQEFVNKKIAWLSTWQQRRNRPQVGSGDRPV